MTAGTPLTLTGARSFPPALRMPSNGLLVHPTCCFCMTLISHCSDLSTGFRAKLDF